MSGLESIALAVAHLEEQRELQQQQREMDRSDPTIAGIPSVSVSTVSTFSSPPPPPPPQAPTRVVSTDESSFSSTSQPQTQSASLRAQKSTFGYILADPLKWLQKTYDRPPLQPSGESVITKVESVDVLCGRGGETNHHPGNIQYRLLVKAFQPHYVSAKRREKPLIAKCIVYSVRQVGGRFLKRTTDNDWVDVGNTKAREKTSQALREGAPELRGGEKKQQTSQAPPLPPTVPAFNLTQLQYPPSAPPLQVDTQLFSAFLTPLQQALSRGHVNGTARVVVTPPQQRYSVSPVVTTTTTAQTVVCAGTKRPPSIVSSDCHSDSDSISDTATTTSTSSASRGGPRLKRFKKRVEQEGSSV